VLPVALVDPGRGAEYGSAGGAEASGDGGDALELTAAGVRHPVMRLAATPEETRERWRAVPRLAGAVATGGPKPGATLLALTPAQPGRPGRPLIAIQRYGAGRAMVFAGRAAWRWRMRMPADDRTYEVFWGQVARWLTGSARDPITLASRGGAAPGNGLEIDLRVRDEAFAPVLNALPVLSVTGPDGATREVHPELVDAAEGRYLAAVPSAEPGVYRLDAVVDRGGKRLGAATDWALVGGADAELADPWLNVPVLERAAAATGGRYFEPDGVDALGASILDGFAAPPAAIRTPLWHNVWMFLWLVAVLAAEWGLRRRWGLR
jgi:hypothetical protein